MTRIVDRYHVKEPLNQVGKAIYGQSEAAHRWARRRHPELDSGHWRSLTRAWACHALGSPKARSFLQYLERNRHRLRHPEFHAQHLCPPQGPWEPDARWLWASDVLGHHWTVRGSNAIICPAVLRTQPAI